MNSFSRKLITASAISLALGVGTVSANTFKFAYLGDAQGLDPHALNETFTLGFQANFYEGLTAYDSDMNLIPSLAESWETPEPKRWVFHLRKGVKFHNGNDFTAEDVEFSWQRALSKGSDLKGRAGLVTNVKIIDDYTVELTTAKPQPTLAREWNTLYIMDKDWATEHKSLTSANLKVEGAGNYATTHENGTGPYIVTERRPDIKTTLKRYTGYWKKLDSNVTEIIFTPVKEASTRTAALISGELDMVFPVMVQDWERLEKEKGVSALTGPEARTIFFGMDSSRDELLYSNIKGKNPLKDIRVRKAFAHALNLNAINKKIMRGASTPTGLLVAPQDEGFVKSLNTPYEYNPKLSKQLLLEAGYPDGFEITIDCPNNRYVNDEKICQAAASMLAKVDVKVKVFAQPKSKYFGKVLAQNNYDTSFYLLGWTPTSMDIYNVFNNLIMCQNKEEKTGTFNLGNWCNSRVDELAAQIGAETNQEKRKAMIEEAMKIVKDDVAYLPLHQQPLSWGVSDRVSVSQRADNTFDFRYINVK